MADRSSGPHAGDDPHGDEPLVTAGTPLNDADAALVFVHGRGATARSVVDLGEQSAGDRDVAILEPAAAGNTWYPNSFLAPVADNEPGRSSGLRAVGSAVDRVVDAGIARDRVLVGGFSQGACLASEFVARNPTRYGGLAVFSGGLIGETVAVDDYLADATGGSGGETEGGAEEPLAGTPAFVGCSDVDPHIPEGRVHETTAVLEALGADVDERIYEGMGHGINDDEVAAVSELAASLA
ncbi:phospholipase/carboxylesterase [Halorubrum californiense DSM 19288]|uniref:Phospholipase/carboxylesterase n=1 Tax=Halorubrum californiense DSM 19288 TaxID=1227465 RepID=M0E3K0_9EURY|nr:MULTISPECIES: phospholipase/carboxylesterase [Halorubrum]ELZ41502.1 phospholipase/carboxylesterase [Halorubrum californiense DSM 19288]TKX65844.1 phospholipase [Halorubrum sp. GN11GM_10-3_MGM]